MDISCDHIIFRDETNYIDNSIQLLYCAPQYFDEDEKVIKQMRGNVVEFLVQSFVKFHEHVTALKSYQDSKSFDENDYSNLKNICRVLQQLKSDSHSIKKLGQNVLKRHQKASDTFKLLSSMKTKHMVGHVQETKLKTTMNILLHLLNCDDTDFSGTLEDPQIYIEQQSKQLEDQQKKALKDLELYVTAVRFNTSEKVLSANQKLKENHSNQVNNWVIKEKPLKKMNVKLNKNYCKNYIHISFAWK